MIFAICKDNNYKKEKKLKKKKKERNIRVFIFPFFLDEGTLSFLLSFPLRNKFICEVQLSP